jgi:hypothetical protein
MDTDHDDDSNETPAPPRLIAALRRTQANRVFVPPATDDAVLRAAQNHFAPGKLRGSVALTHWFRWLAFATACLLLCAVAYRLTRPGSFPAHAQEDLNRDGRVDILDAFQLARQLQARDNPATGPDLNGDGEVDQRDVEIIAAQAVKLEKGGRS